MLRGGPKADPVLLVVAPDRVVAQYVLDNHGVDTRGDGWRLVWGPSQLRGWRDGCPVLLPEDAHLSALLQDGRGGAAFASLVSIVRARFASGKLRPATPDDIAAASVPVHAEGLAWG